MRYSGCITLNGMCIDSLCYSPDFNFLKVYYGIYDTNGSSTLPTYRGKEEKGKIV